MTHNEMLEQFLLQNLKEGVLVEIELTDGRIITGKLSSDKVWADTASGDNSRIGLLPPPPPPGQIVVSIPKTIYSVNIQRITRL